jgi:hypothetical protein
VLQYKQPWLQQKVLTAFAAADKTSVSFQRALMELVYTQYKTGFAHEVHQLMAAATNAKVFAMCAEYLLRTDTSAKAVSALARMAFEKRTQYFLADESSALLAFKIQGRITELMNHTAVASGNTLHELLTRAAFKNNTVLYSIQRKNRNYPGIAIIRDSAGNFLTDSTGKLFSVAQLARSITDLPGYLTNGNTPQGVFRMNGFAVSRSPAIGPTENIQLMMPLETSVQYFLKDSSITDTVWTKALYQRVLPQGLQNHQPLYDSYDASAIGRTEIIAHGTTVDPGFYKNEPYWPLTPTQGCLCTKEIWSEADGKRTISDQQKLVNALKAAGGANGYLVVIEIDNQQKPVGIEEILPYIKAAGK